MEPHTTCNGHPQVTTNESMEGCMCWYYLLTFRLQGCLFVVEFKEMFYLTYLGNISRSMLIAHALPYYNSLESEKITGANMKILQTSPFV